MDADCVPGTGCWGCSREGTESSGKCRGGKKWVKVARVSQAGWVVAGRGGWQCCGACLRCPWRHAKPIPGILSPEWCPGTPATRQGRSPLVSRARWEGQGGSLRMTTQPEMAKLGSNPWAVCAQGRSAHNPYTCPWRGGQTMGPQGVLPTSLRSGVTVLHQTHPGASLVCQARERRSRCSLGWGRRPAKEV